jgi:hypothetical protein
VTLNLAINNLLAAPVTIPPQFLGMQCELGPTCGSASNLIARNLGYAPADGTYGHVFSECFYINQSAGTYIWNAVDDFCTNFPTQQLIFELGLPPAYMFTRTPLGGPGTGAGPQACVNMCPQSGVDHLTGANSWQSFITAYITRVAITNGRTGCAWELWNEFDDSAYADPISYLGPYAKVTAQAIHAVDPTAIILAPSISPGNYVNGHTAEDITTFLSASDGASGHAGGWVSGICYHAYENFSQTGSTDGQYNPLQLVTHLGYVQAAQVAAGYNYPIWMTEGGYTIHEPHQVLDTQRQIITLAGLGVAHYCGFGWDDVDFALSGIVTQWNALAAIVAPGNVMSVLTVSPSAVQCVVNGTAYKY